MQIINEKAIKNKKVLLRVDYNVPLDNNGKIIDNSRIKKSLITINFLLKNSSKIILISHMGRIKSEEDKKMYSLRSIANELSLLLSQDVLFIGSQDFKEIKESIFNSKEKIILLENSRFYDFKLNLESKCSNELAINYAQLGDIYINDAFGSSHRRHVTTYGIRKHIPSYYGFLINEELNNLNSLIHITQRPFVVFMGGAKVEDKLPIIKKMLEKCDYLCLGGGILNSFLKANGFDIKDSLSTNDDKILVDLKCLLKKYPEKIKLTTKVVWDNDKILDIDISDYKKEIINSKLCFINGTPGLYENDKFSQGTIDLLKCASNIKSKVIIGGGDTAAAVSKFKMEGNFNFISTGGGASLEYISNNSLSALDDL